MFLINHYDPEVTTNQYIKTLETCIIQQESKTTEEHW